jgi:uncharacterized membrane protein YedE/YeeE
MKKSLALLFGTVFGFLLQRGGVGDYDVLLGQLLLKDWTVAKIMLSAILVGSVGLFALKALGKVELQLKKTRLAANILGGLIFGAGFGLSGYCPGSAAAALGQGRWDALVAMGGMVFGSYLYALSSGLLSQTVEKWGDLGKVTLADLAGQPLARILPVFSGILLLALATLTFLT